MTAAEPLVAAMEDEFWKSFMPAGATPTEEMAVDQSAGRKPEEASGHKEDDGRGGKWAKDNQKGKGRTQYADKTDKWASEDGQGRGGGGGRRYQSEREKEYKWSDRSWKESEIEGLKRQLASAQRLLLRHEDAINTLKAEHSYVLHLRINIPSTIVPSLSKARAGWHALRSEKPAEVTRPMRVTLWTCLLQEWLARLVALPSVPETIAGLDKLGWFDSQKNELKADQQQLGEDPARTPLPYEQGKGLLQELIRVSVSSGVIARFFPTRPLAAEMRRESVTFLLQLCTRGADAEKAHDILNTFCGSACCLLVGMQVKQDRGVRSGLAQAISKEIPA